MPSAKKSINEKKQEKLQKARKNIPSILAPYNGEFDVLKAKFNDLSKNTKGSEELKKVNAQKRRYYYNKNIVDEMNASIEVDSSDSSSSSDEEMNSPQKQNACGSPMSLDSSKRSMSDLSKGSKDEEEDTVVVEDASDDEGAFEDGCRDIGSFSFQDAFSIGCGNCHRRQSIALMRKYGDSAPYCIQFECHRSDTIKPRRRLKFCASSRAGNEDTLRDVLLCSECANHLVKIEDTDESNNCKYTWPGFIWSCLENKNVREIYGNKMWKIVPQMWRHWWLEAVKLLEGPPSYRDVSIETPKSIFIDRTKDIKEWDADIESFLLGRLRDTCNKHLMPNVLCPWGCSEYNHKCGKIVFDVIIQRYFQGCILPRFYTKNWEKVFEKVVSARNDYFREEGSKKIQQGQLITSF